MPFSMAGTDRRRVDQLAPGDVIRTVTLDFEPVLLNVVSVAPIRSGASFSEVRVYLRREGDDKYSSAVWPREQVVGILLP